MIDNIFIQISVLLGITVSVAFLMRVLRQPLLIAYLLAGIIAGPMFLNLLQSGGQTFDALAEFGIVLLLFVVGLSLNLQHIKSIGKVAVITGLTQVTFTTTVGFLLLLAMKFPFSSAIYLAIALTFSSTIIIVKLLAEKKDTESVYGRYTIGLMVVQDLVAIFIMMVVTSVGTGDGLWLEIGTLVGKIFILFGFVILTARYIIPKLLDSVARSDEFLFIFTITWCFGIASLLYWLGFSLEIGAIIAGLTLGSSPYQSEIASRVKPLRDFFIIIFFIILGSEMSLANISNIWAIGLILSIFILIGNPFILYSVFRFLKFTRRNSFLSGVTAAQVSEFGFVLLIVGRNSGHIMGNELEIFTIVALITIITSSYIITYNGQVFDFLHPFFKLFGPDKHKQKEDTQEKYDVFVFGYHRIGWKVCEALAEKEIKYAVVDYNPEAITRLKSRGIAAFFGDVRDIEFLETLPLSNTKMVISTIPDHDDQITLFSYVRKINKKTILIGNLYHNTYLDDLYEAGANYVMMTHLLGGEWIADVIKGKSWTEKTFLDLRKHQKQEMQLRFTSGINSLK
ncbi:MAG: sodium/hydrogen exchanger [uncultured bacterium]|nr:MAG: sodium/hydrogen exchanger [uncultured bacterium]OGH91020.1 MAG: hypothetical protein A2507_02080 [Candidatus Magasanikbacteria bacterium RIFOXYD12_FULL_33_17]HAO52344.1 hypothetical protein [Candidatus Magasanikbacteria bacterium]